MPDVGQLPVQNLYSASTATGLERTRVTAHSAPVKNAGQAHGRRTATNGTRCRGTCRGTHGSRRARAALAHRGARPIGHAPVLRALPPPHRAVPDEDHGTPGARRGDRQRYAADRLATRGTVPRRLAHL